MDFIAQFDVNVELGIRLFLAEIVPVSFVKKNYKLCRFLENNEKIDNAKILTARISLRIIIYLHIQHLPKPKIEKCTTC